MNTPATTNRSLTTVAFERLQRDILGGKLQPDARLRIHALSEAYGIGATAIREALSRLVTDGLVTAEDQRGFCVASVSADELLDLTQTRVRVDEMALRQALERGDVEWESNLLGAFHRLSCAEQPTSPDQQAAWTAVHRAFHGALIQGCGSNWMIYLCTLLYDKSERYRNLAQQYTHVDYRDVGPMHRPLLDAAMARDADKLCRLAAEHAWRSTNVILKIGVGKRPTSAVSRVRRKDAAAGDRGQRVS